MELSCSLAGTTGSVPQEKFLRKPYNKSFIDQACSPGDGLILALFFFASLWTSVHKRGGP